MRLPDFIIGGAPRCATTWLWHLAEGHPRLAMAKPLRPEPKFFIDDRLYARGPAYYAATWFDALPADRLAGEKSTNYLEVGAAAARIRATVPGIKLIFALRDPVERAWSNWRWSRQNGFEHRSFAQALAEEREHSAAAEPPPYHPRPHAYFSRGLYADLLKPYFHMFAREQLLVVFFEDIARAPEAAAVAVQRFLGVEERPSDARTLAPVNASLPVRGEPEISPALRRNLIVGYREANERLARLLDLGSLPWPCEG
jgi:Sulfotransferase domain